MDKKEYRVLIKHCFLAKKNTIEAKAWLDKHYSDFAPGKSTVEKWFAKFKRGEMSTEDDARSGRPKEAVTDENIIKVHKIISDNPKVKLIEIAETLKISKERVGHIVNEYLGMRKLSSKWVSRELSTDEKQRIDSNHISENSKVFNFSDYDCIGFDLDNTICKYKVGPMIKLEYNAIANFLVNNRNYSSKHLLKPVEENLDFLLKGLVIDFYNGNVLKINSNGKIINASHGTKPLTKTEIEKQYGVQKHWSVTDTFVNNFLKTWNGPLSQQMRSLLDYFDMPTSLAFARVVDTLDEVEGKPLKNYDIWPDLLAALSDMFDTSHFKENKGGYFPIIKSNPDQYIHKCSNDVINWLKSLKANNKKLFLITGSHVDFATLTSKTCMGENWRELFDILIFFAKKPGFFTENRPFLNANTSELVSANDLKQNGLYVHGNWRDLNLFLSKITNKTDPKIVYVGDNLIQDVYTPAVYTSCDSVAVCEELEAEGVFGFNREHDHIEHLISERWGSFFLGNDEGNKCATVWYDIIKKYSRICVPNIDYFANKPIDYKFKL